MFFRHHTDDFTVGLAHADAREPSDVFDRVFHALDDDPVSSVELVSALVHGKAQKSRVHGRGDLCRAACFRAVTDDPGLRRERVHDGMRDLVEPSAVEIGDARGGSAAGADHAAVSGEPSDAGLEMDRDKVGDKKRP